MSDFEDENDNGNVDDSYDSDDFDDMAHITAAAGALVVVKLLLKQPYRDDMLTGAEYVMRVITRNGNRCIDMLRMEQHVFLNLCATLRSKGLNNSRISVEEKVAMLLMTLGHANSNRVIADRFQHSGETVSRHVNKVLLVICEWAKEIVVAPDLNVTPPHILHSSKYMPWFENCIGAIDGTHISANVPQNQQVAYRGRKSTLTTNLMAACDFDMRFTFIYPGWEGSANDSRVLNAALDKPILQFPHPPLGKYYVVDAGYPNMPGFLAPHRHTWYHLSEFRGGHGVSRRPRRS